MTGYLETIFGRDDRLCRRCRRPVVGRVRGEFCEPCEEFLSSVRAECAETSRPTNGAAAAADTPGMLRPSQTLHGRHEVRQLERPTCARCGRGKASGVGRYPAYCEPCEQLKLDHEQDAARELDDARAEAQS